MSETHPLWCLYYSNTKHQTKKYRFMKSGILVLFHCCSQWDACYAASVDFPERRLGFAA
ncbi:hypothetical protein FX988_00848 [Paraglaciecola mesophila]|uniref:Uncharacterized protein n=1 Tax=Paraglaciecola mesophila TaxID=197222 RepID=A0A857JF40_9ALTE|nr:hypothetical protein FX988_00848 [Paraglaciecola mesophila]